MWSSIGATGVASVVGLAACRVLIVLIALRGTKPSERAVIIHALNDGLTRALPRRKRAGAQRSKSAGTLTSNNGS